MKGKIFYSPPPPSRTPREGEGETQQPEETKGRAKGQWRPVLRSQDATENQPSSQDRNWPQRGHMMFRMLHPPVVKGADAVKENHQKDTESISPLAYMVVSQQPGPS